MELKDIITTFEKPPNNIPMENQTVHALYFSPAYSTKNIVKNIAMGISPDFTEHDITEKGNYAKEFNTSDIVVIGVPVYAGRVPQVAVERISTISGNKTPVILVCVYGNRDYDDALLELKNLCVERGFVPISAGAFIARHSIFPNVAKTRPEEEDLIAAQRFGKESFEIVSKIMASTSEYTLAIKGNFPYKAPGKIPLTPKTKATCTKCGRCVKHCPVGAIDAKNPHKTKKKLCVSCAGCIATCPEKARFFGGLVYSMAIRRFTENFSGRKENELIMPQ